MRNQGHAEGPSNSSIGAPVGSREVLSAVAMNRNSIRNTNSCVPHYPSVRVPSLFSGVELLSIPERLSGSRYDRLTYLLAKKARCDRNHLFLFHLVAPTRTQPSVPNLSASSPCLLWNQMRGRVSGKGQTRWELTSQAGCLEGNKVYELSSCQVLATAVFMLSGAGDFCF